MIWNLFLCFRPPGNGPYLAPPQGDPGPNRRGGVAAASPPTALLRPGYPPVSMPAAPLRYMVPGTVAGPTAYTASNGQVYVRDAQVIFLFLSYRFFFIFYLFLCQISWPFISPFSPSFLLFPLLFPFILIFFSPCLPPFLLILQCSFFCTKQKKLVRFSVNFD